MSSPDPKKPAPKPKSRTRKTVERGGWMAIGMAVFELVRVLASVFG